MPFARACCYPVEITLAQLRSYAVRRTLFPPAPIASAVARLGFVQADPIRSPARAQDLILRHRCPNYRAGDLHAHYPDAPLEEAYLYAYGFVPAHVRDLLLRADRKITAFERRVLDAAREHPEPFAPATLENHVTPKSRTATNAWGGSSKTVTLAIERLQHLGYLRVARRDPSGNRIYEPARESAVSAAPPVDRLRDLIRLTLQILSPIPEKWAASIASFLRSRVAPLANHRHLLRDLQSTGEIARKEIEGLAYLWPAIENPLAQASQETQVRILAPFDPIVWDRLRFEHLWGWAYRFEAYTPAAKRIRGYYAMPLLWRDGVVGWANVNSEGQAETGFVSGSKPRHRTFSRELEAELARLRFTLDKSL